MALVLVGILATAATGGCTTDDEGVPAAATTTVATVATMTVTTSETVTETTASAPATAPSGRAPKARKGLRFSGNGDRLLPPFTVMRGGAILRWSNNGEVFSLFGAEGTLVDSVANQGWTFLPRGVHRIDVVASGSWIIRVPRARRAR